jgi:hypothetical protein
MADLWASFARRVGESPDWLTTADRLAIGIKLMATEDAIRSCAPNSEEMLASAAATLQRAFDENIAMDAPDDLDADPANSEAALG